MGYLVRLIDANKILLALISIFLISTLSVYAQERIDVIYLTNGDIAKGIIIENVPNEYVKIEFPNGSVLTFNYSEIAKFAVELSKPEKTQQELLPFHKDTIEFEINIGPGIFHPLGEKMNDIHGDGFIWGADLLAISKNGYGIGIGVSYFTNSGNLLLKDNWGHYYPNDIKTILISIPISGIYRYELKSIESFILTVGAGLGYYSINSDIHSINNFEDSFNNNTFGVQVFGMIKYKMGIMRLSLSSARVSSDEYRYVLGKSAEIGGISLMAGISF